MAETPCGWVLESRSDHRTRTKGLHICYYRSNVFCFFNLIGFLVKDRSEICRHHARSL